MADPESSNAKKRPSVDALNVGPESTQTPAALPPAEIATSQSPGTADWFEFDRIVQVLRDALLSARSLLEDARSAIRQPYSPPAEPPQKSESVEAADNEYSDAEAAPWESPNGWAKRLDRLQHDARCWTYSLDVNQLNDVKDRTERRNSLAGRPPVSVGDEVFRSAIGAAIWALSTVEMLCPVWLGKPVTPEDEAILAGFPEPPLGSLKDRVTKFLTTLADPQRGITTACLADLAVRLDVEAAVARDLEMRVDRAPVQRGEPPTAGSAAPPLPFTFAENAIYEALKKAGHPLKTGPLLHKAGLKETGTNKYCLATMVERRWLKQIPRQGYALPEWSD